MEAAGIEPASKCVTEEATTCLVSRFILLLKTPTDRLSQPQSDCRHKPNSRRKPHLPSRQYDGFPRAPATQGSPAAYIKLLVRNRCRLSFVTHFGRVTSPPLACSSTRLVAPVETSAPPYVLWRDQAGRVQVL